MTDKIWKDIDLHRLMGKEYEQVILKEKILMLFPAMKLSNVKNKLQYPKLP